MRKTILTTIICMGCFIWSCTSQEKKMDVSEVPSDKSLRLPSSNVNDTEQKEAKDILNKQCTKMYNANNADSQKCFVAKDSSCAFRKEAVQLCNLLYDRDKGAFVPCLEAIANKNTDSDQLNVLRCKELFKSVEQVGTKSIVECLGIPVPAGTCSQ